MLTERYPRDLGELTVFQNNSHCFQSPVSQDTGR